MEGPDKKDWENQMMELMKIEPGRDLPFLKRRLLVHTSVPAFQPQPWFTHSNSHIRLYSMCPMQFSVEETGASGKIRPGDEKVPQG